MVPRRFDSGHLHSRVVQSTSISWSRFLHGSFMDAAAAAAAAAAPILSLRFSCLLY